MDWLKSIFDGSSLMPHGYCLVWNPGLIWLHAVSDGLIGVAYFSIPLALIYFLIRRPDVGFGWIFQLFAAFILLCGTTHFVEIWTLFHSDYAIQGMIKAVTALVSVATAALVATVPLNVKSQGGRGDIARTLGVCERMLDDRDDMVIKAMSWALRELVVHDPHAVAAFLATHDARLASRVKREVRNKLTTGLKNP